MRLGHTVVMPDIHLSNQEYNEQSAICMQSAGQSGANLKKLAHTLRERNLTGPALVALSVLDIWGFVGAQLVWMLMPLIQTDACAEFAEVLEDPEALRQFRQYLVEGSL